MLDPVEAARKYIESDDPSLAVYMCRDLQVTKDAGLTDLAWTLCNDGYCHKNDVKGFFELLDKYIEDQVMQQWQD